MNLFLPLLILLLGILFLRRPGRAAGAFLSGAERGFSSAVKLFPTLLLFVTAVALFRASGAVELLSEVLSPVCEKIGVPAELLPLLITRPVSGSASTAVLSDILSSCGADSFTGLCASVVAGSSETVLYVISIYCTGGRMQKMRGVLPAAVMTNVFVTVLTVWVSGVLFK
ncbi:MAG: spore maturation protein [Clostridia bacterium]|nr:spore maturation protein [Clostridia bacterium]